MRKILFIAVLFVVISSCSKDDDSALPTKMSAAIGNAEWSSITRVTVLTDKGFVITGTSLDGKSLSITILGSTEGTYELSLNSVQFGAVYKESVSTSTGDAYAAISGEVVITNIDASSKEISGTFNFVLKKELAGESISVTGGTFTNLKYTEQK
jgi:hypothetical protein